MHGLKPLRMIVVCLLMAASAVAAESPLTVAAAADLNFALTEIASKFEQQTGTRVRLSFGSSGNLSMQIQNGAPFDVFLSADMEYARQLDAAGLTVPGTLTRYATGRLALVVPSGSPLPVTTAGMEVLRDRSVRRIAIANPQHAPYGRAAVAALRHYGLYDALASKIVVGENVSQATQFLQSGNAQAGLVALSLVLTPAMKTRYWVLPAGTYPALDQAAVVLKSSRHQALARRFLEFLKTAPARETLVRYGFAVTEAR